MLKKLFGLFKKDKEKSQKPQNPQEFLDFSDFTDVHIAGTRTIRPEEMEKKGSNKLAQIAKPDPVEKKSKKQDIPDLNTAILNQYKEVTSPNPDLGPPPIDNLTKSDMFVDDTEHDISREEHQTQIVTSPPMGSLTKVVDESSLDDMLGSDHNFTAVHLTDGESEREKTSFFDKLKLTFKRLSGKEDDTKMMDMTSTSKTIMGRYDTVQFKIGKDDQKKSKIIKYAFALLLLLLVGVGGYNFLMEDDSAIPAVTVKKPKNDKASTKNKAESTVVKETKETGAKKSPEKKETVKAQTKKSDSEATSKVVSKQAPSKAQESSAEADATPIKEDIIPAKKVESKKSKVAQKPLEPDRERPAFNEIDPEVTDTGKLSEDDLIDIENDLSNDVSFTSDLELKDLNVQYLSAGAGLVYNCSGKHWACVSRINFEKCRRLSSMSPVKCYAVKNYASKRTCQINQIKRINTNTDTTFCR